MATKTNLYSGEAASSWGGSEFITIIPVVAPSGSDLLAVRLSGGVSPPRSITLKSTVDGVFTQEVFLSDGNSQAVGIYYLESPEAGSFNLEVDTANTSKTFYFLVDAILGASGVGVSGSVAGYSTGNTLTLTTAIGDVVIDIFNAGAAATKGADQTNDMTLDGRTTASSLIADAATENMTWTMASQRWVHGALVLTAGGATDTITPPSNIKFGETVTVANSGFASGAPNAGTIGGQTATVSGTSVTLPNIASVADGTVVSDTGSQAISLTNGTESAASTITVDLPTGYIETAMTTVDAATNGTLGNLLLTVGYTLVTGDKIVIDATDGSTTNADSSYSWQFPKDFTVVRAADNTAYQYTLNAEGTISKRYNRAIRPATRSSITSAIKGI